MKKTSRSGLLWQLGKNKFIEQGSRNKSACRLREEIQI
jgi:hypothetical protein